MKSQRAPFCPLPRPSPARRYRNPEKEAGQGGGTRSCAGAMYLVQRGQQTPRVSRPSSRPQECCSSRRKEMGFHSTLRSRCRQVKKVEKGASGVTGHALCPAWAGGRGAGVPTGRLDSSRSSWGFVWYTPNPGLTTTLE